MMYCKLPRWAYGLHPLVVLWLALLTVSANAAEGFVPDSAGVRASYAADSGAGLGAELAWDAGENWRIRAGVDRYSDSQEHLISLIRFHEQHERNDVGLFLDRKLAGDSGWYATGGIVHPGQGSRWDADPDQRMGYTLNGRQYAGIHLSEPVGEVSYTALAPYAGVGWRVADNKGWQVGAEIGVLAGLDPTFSIYTDNPYQLPYLEQDLQAEADKYLTTTQASTHLSGEQQLTARVSISYAF